MPLPLKRMLCMKVFLESLNDEQTKAVETQGNVLCLAGAGSGKTRTTVIAVGNKLQQGINPQDILALTFTNKAAKEMKERLVKMRLFNAFIR